MTMNVLLISGPRFSGKSTLLRMIAARLCPDQPHYLRLVPVDPEDAPRLTLLGDLKAAGLSSWRRVNYDADHIFEFLPEVLNEIAEMRTSRHVLIESDADPNLRFAYPYDHRLFIMPAPRLMEEVFRSPAEAAQALREVMDDTAAFASEMFGLFNPDSDEDEGVSYQRTRDRSGVAEERLDISPTQMRRFMMSPLGAEIASRIQLQPAYHGLIESDVILINTAVGGRSHVVDLCIQRLQMMIYRLGEGRTSLPAVFYCDPLDFADPLQYQLLKRIRSMLAT
ncbi:MAG: hypothetical protein HJJLKODD_00725 [Phycisphaerae bacterium]|nr:hypothetical protein [Phycisphaerae bacterium]